ncbi:MAG: peptide chain release factor-like protein [Candidatus Gracilibacteria bacterium]|jgi:protein subunit release factor B|nr:peptide chain release factor-like protein [Candidatus Gracilibacteria bacterium]
MNFPIELSLNLLNKASSLNILPNDISEQFVRGGGKGGQKINKTSSTVLLKHLPTGIEVRCQKHREQSKNRLSAYKLLILKIEEVKLGKESDLAKKIFKLKKQKMKRSKRAKEKILDQKKQRSEIKALRKDVI